MSLQAQIIDKDGPTISAAAERVYGKPVRFAVLKGWSNYSCLQRTRETVAGLLGAVGHVSNSALADQLEQMKFGAAVHIDGYDYDSATLIPLLAWALRQHEDSRLSADRAAYPGVASNLEWALVSVSTQECLGESGCPVFELCKPAAARSVVAEADIVVTNHSMLAVQAATALPVVLGNSGLGDFQNIIVDEAHALPGTVRSQGQSQVSARRITKVIALVRRVLSDTDAGVKRWIDDGDAVATAVDDELRRRLKAAPFEPGDEVSVPGDVDPLNDTADLVISWAKRGDRLLANATADAESQSVKIAAKRARAEVTQLGSDVDAVREHFVGVARWWKRPAKFGGGHGRRESVSVTAAPVEVSRMIDRNVWTVVPSDEEDAEPMQLSVVAMSATLPTGFARDAAIRSQSREYESPFDARYGDSAFFAPRVISPAEVAALSAPGPRGGKPKFDTTKHAGWALPYMVDLVDANGGSALVLSSTVDAGKKYTESLREAARGRWRVLSQWDGANIRQIKADWEDDRTAVLVGTKTLMTGTDAPGETCSLVIVDRPPRARANPIDNARVEALAPNHGGKWGADRIVYAGDAATLLEQSVGRLIRSMSDSGLAAILDPRLVKSSPFAYPEATRDIYIHAVRRFDRKYSQLSKATEFLRERRAKTNQS
ncbi:ATP-dependent DNA helicase [Agromyces subbeticus]|uniref:ATP-dependent DNA helicase n=1 Tax=Agromyces subbeticus TaxID=293890 RepID=UPI0012EC0257|nr:helicase C-terminal domain-containing protein [Agromyces subbeticus]